MKNDDDERPDVPADPKLLARRQMLGRVCVGLGIASGAALGVPMVGFVVGPLLKKYPTDEWMPVTQAFYWVEPRDKPGGGDFQWRAEPDAPPPRLVHADSIAVGETVPVKFEDPSVLPWAGVTGLTAAWVRRVSETEFVAYSVNCAHLGCPVQWRPSAQLFLCPCHGGVYYADGTVAAGPPPHPLPRYQVRVRDGRIEILAQPLPIG
jgi:quinol---cytochrome c reductase iron-sulfur subunit, bacillus type